MAINGKNREEILGYNRCNKCPNHKNGDNDQILRPVTSFIKNLMKIHEEQQENNHVDSDYIDWD